MAALDQPRTDDSPADHVARQAKLEQARVRLVALAGALDAVGLRCRWMETAQERMALLRVRDGDRQHPQETVACLLLKGGWRFTSYPHGPVLADADGITGPSDAHAAARVIAAYVAKNQRDRSHVGKPVQAAE